MTFICQHCFRSFYLRKWLRNYFSTKMVWRLLSAKTASGLVSAEWASGLLSEKPASSLLSTRMVSTMKKRSDRMLYGGTPPPQFYYADMLPPDLCLKDGFRSFICRAASSLLSE